MSAPRQTLGQGLFRHLSSKLRRKLKMRPSEKELDPYLSQKELIFRAPPFAPDLVATIKLLSPQFHLRPDEASRRFWELNQNGLCWGEFEALRPFLKRLESPSRVLDIGPGLGRSTVFFKKILGWKTVPFDLYDSTGTSTKYTKAGPRFEDSFCGNLDALQAVLKFNEIENFEIFDAAETDAKLTRFTGPYDFIYSFFAVGFHWSINHFLDEILRLMDERSLGAFTLHDRFADFSALADVPHRVVEFRRSWPPGRFTRMLLLSKTAKALQDAA